MIEATDPRTARVAVAPGALVLQAARLVRERAARLVVMTGTDERELGRGFVIYCVFAAGDGERVTLETSIDPERPVYPALTPEIPAAHWYEREIHDLLGVVPTGHPDLRRLVLHEDWPDGAHPLRRDFDARARVPRVAHAGGARTGVHGEGIMEVPVGPIHAGIIEPGHFRFGGVGELVLQLEAQLFYTHRGIEKSAEGQSVERVLFLAERICAACSLSHGIAYAQAIEGLAGVRVSPRAALVRSILLELERLYSHVGDIANLCNGASLQLGAYQGGVLKERLQRLNERVAGHRYLFGVARPGGVRRDLDAAAQRDIRSTLPEIEAEFRSYLAAVIETDSFMERLIGTGILTHDIADELGAVGVAARASGVARDVRAERAYAAYDPDGFVPVVRSEGDARARLHVRADETLASFDLVRGFLDELALVPTGDLARAVGPLPPRSWAMGVVESPRGENVHWVQTGARGEIYRYRVRSASYNWSVVPFAVPGNLLPDFPIINKSFELCYACLDR